MADLSLINANYNEHNRRMLNPCTATIRIDKTRILIRIEHMSYRWIRASEIAEFTYCRRAWWLKHTRGLPPDNSRQLRSGSHYHKQHGNRVRLVPLMRGLAYTLLFCVVFYVVFQLLISL